MGNYDYASINHIEGKTDYGKEGRHWKSGF